MDAGLTGRRCAGTRQARRFVRSLELGSVKRWVPYMRGELKEKPSRPATLPWHPEQVYRDEGWVGWPDFLRQA